MENETWLKNSRSGVHVSDMGRVKGKRGIPSKGHRRGEYLHFQNVYQETMPVHILVLETFRPEHRRDQGYRAHWIDGDKLNNKLSNLKWVERIRKRMSKQQRMKEDLKYIPFEFDNSYYGRSLELPKSPWPEKKNNTPPSSTQ